jgi:hypothetical protein
MSAALEKTLKAISIPLGSSVGAFDGGSGLIRIYHGGKAGSTSSFETPSSRSGNRYLNLSGRLPNGSCHRRRQPPGPTCSATQNRRSLPCRAARTRNCSREPMDEKRPLRRQADDHHLWSLIMLAVTAGAFLLVTWVATKALFLLLQESPIP